MSWDDLQTAVANEVVTAEQADRLWHRFDHRTSARPRFDAAHVAYYQRNSKAIAESLQARLPQPIRDMIPPRART